MWVGHIPSSDPNGADSILESEIDTNEINPDKVMYQPGSAMEGDLLSDLSAIPTFPVRRTYAKVASLKYKSREAVHVEATLGTMSAKLVAAATKPTEQAPVKLKVVQPKVLVNSQTKSHVLNRKADKAHESDSVTESTPTLTVLLQPPNLKTPTPLKKSKQTKVVPLHGTDTELELLPHKPNPHSLQ